MTAAPAATATTCDPLPRTDTRVRLRRLAAADLPRFLACRGDPESGRWPGWPPPDAAAGAGFVREMAAVPFGAAGRWLQLAVAAIDSDEWIGNIGLRPDAAGDAVEIGCTLAREAQGHGLAAAAVALAIELVFERTAAARIVAVTDTRSTAALRLLRRLGFRPCSTRDAVFRGAPCREQHFVRHRPGRVAVRLRPAQATDAGAVARVLIESRRVLMPFAPSAHPDDEVRDWVAGTLIPAGAVTVAEHAGEIVGVLAASTRGGTGWIDQLCVHPRHVGAGVGIALLTQALATLPRPLRLYTFAANLHARGFYERHGFVAEAYGDGSGNEEHIPDVLYERSAA